MTNQNESGLILLAVLFWLAQTITYVMAAIRWFTTDHRYFWHGFKELVWAMIPVVNFTYVWDWWLAGLAWLDSLAR